MTSVADLRAKYGLPANSKSGAVLNHAIRKSVPGGNEVLDALTRVHEMQHRRNPPDAALQYIIDTLREARDKMCEALLA